MSDLLWGPDIHEKMTTAVEAFIAGAPCTTNNKDSRDAWKAKIRRATLGLPRITSACKLRVEFHLASEAYITSGKFGPDLDNLLKPFMDSLGDTVLAPLGDDCIVDLHAIKMPATTDERAGASLKIEQIEPLEGTT